MGEDAEKTRIRQSINALRVTNPSDDKRRIEDRKGGLYDKSYAWIKENDEYKSWQNGETGRRLLWIRGEPGKGKTMLLCGIIDELAKSNTQGILLSYFFCQGTDSRLNNATCVLRGLIYMLAVQQPSLACHVEAEYEKDTSVFDDINAWYALERVFKNILDDPRLGGVCFVIDALDECETDLKKLVKVVKEKSATCDNVKWIVSSRSWEEIGNMFGDIFSDANGIISLEENSQAVSGAVDSYITY